MLQAILAGLDWGETVDATAEIAAGLAVALGASLKAIYVEDIRLIEATERAALAILPNAGPIPYSAPNLPELEGEFRAEERALGRRFLRLVADTRVRGSFLVERGEVAEILIRESRAHDLVVLGKYSGGRREGESRRPLGDHVEEVVRRTYCPAVLVPPGARLGDRFLVAYDGSEGAHRALATAVRLARATEARLAIVAVGHPEVTTPLLEESRAYAEAHRAGVRLVAREGRPAEEIAEEAAGWEADLVAMGAHGPHRRRGTFPPETALEVARNLDVTALICGSREED